MLKKLLIGFFVTVGLLLLIGFLLPSTLEFEVEKEVGVPASALFENVNNLSTWSDWDPWSQKDPNIQVEIKGPSQGMGQIRTWKSDHKEVGNGTQKIITSIENELIETHMKFDEQGEADGWWKFEDLGSKTKVTWGFRSDFGKPFGGYMVLIFKNQIQKQFNKGIDNLVAYTNGK